MDLTTAVTDAVATLRRRPADLLPFYILGMAIPVVARVAVVGGATAVYVYLSATGGIARFQAQYASANIGSPPNPNENPEAFSQWSGEVGSVVEPLIDPVVVGVLVGALLAAALIALLMQAGVAAGQYTACLARLRDDRGLTAGIAGVRQYGVALLLLYLLEVAIWLAVSLFAAVVIAVAAATGQTVLAALVTLLAFLGWSVVVIATRATFAFAPVALVVDDEGVVGSLGGAVRYLRHEPVAALGYFAVVVSLGVVTTIVSAVFGAVGAGSVVGLFTLLAIAPGLDLLKVGLFGGWRGVTVPPTPPDVRLRDQLRDSIFRGWRTFRTFVRTYPQYPAAAVAIAVAGFVAGWGASAPFESQIQASISARLAGSIPPIAAVEFMANNVTVALGTAFAGVVFAVPAVTALWVNGLVFGIYFRLEAQLVELVLFVLPHGVIEIPAILVAGAVGLRLGVVGWTTWRGSRTRADLADALEEAFWVSVGIGLLLVLAGLVEGFISPYYYQFFLSAVEKLGV